TWNEFFGQIDKVSVEMTEEQVKDAVPPPTNLSSGEEITVYVTGSHYGRCPGCQKRFDYEDEDIGRSVRCRNCHAMLRVVRKPSSDGSA
ncbi:MAG: hypothetical protein ABSE82_11540, partial [Nitrososphaerales archaeon]